MPFSVERRMTYMYNSLTTNVPRQKNHPIDIVHVRHLPGVWHILIKGSGVPSQSPSVCHTFQEMIFEATSAATALPRRSPFSPGSLPNPVYRILEVEMTTYRAHFFCFDVIFCMFRHFLGPHAVKMFDHFSPRLHSKSRCTFMSAPSQAIPCRYASQHGLRIPFKFLLCSFVSLPRIAIKNDDIIRGMSAQLGMGRITVSQEFCQEDRPLFSLKHRLFF